MFIRSGLTGVKVCHNTVVSNTTRRRALDANTEFDNGYPSGGNYWIDYTAWNQPGDLGLTVFPLDVSRDP